MEATPQAKKIWEKIPSEVRMKLLNNVWCVNCRTSVNINASKMSVDTRMLKIEGTCMTCGGKVCRMVENE